METALFLDFPCAGMDFLCVSLCVCVCVCVCCVLCVEVMEAGDSSQYYSICSFTEGEGIKGSLTFIYH
jgi:hypothetical protein